MMTDEQDVVNVENEKIASDKTKGHILDVGPGCLAIELPAGYIDNEGELHVQAILREMKGNEEVLLAGKGPVVPRLNAIIGNCLVRLGTITDERILRIAACNLTAQDRMAILLSLRRISLGDFYDCKVTCPECNVSQHTTLDLSEIEISPMPNRMERELSDTLPSGRVAKWHVIKSEDEEWLTTQRKKEEDILTLGLLSRLDYVDDVKLDRKHKYKEAIKVLMDLSFRDRNALRGLFDRKEDNIDDKVEYECEKCNHQWEGKLDVGQPGFFFPSAK